MMRLSHLAFFGLLTLAIASCGAQRSLRQADEAYHLALQTAEQLRPRLQALNLQKNSLNVQGRALFPDEIEFIREVESIEESYRLWEAGEKKAASGKDSPAPAGPKALYRHQKEWLAAIRHIRERVDAQAGRFR